MSDEEREELKRLMSVDEQVSVLRGFLDRVWGIFRDSKNELGARQRLGKLKRRGEVVPDSAFSKSVSFLVDRFSDMTTFLRVPGVQRNSLADLPQADAKASVDSAA